MKNKRIQKCLFVHKGRATFTLNDLNLLREDYEVVEVTTKYQHGAAFILGQLLVAWQIIRHLWGAKFLYVWFAGYHSILPAFIFWLARKPVYLIIGGYDAAYLPEINYGGHIRWGRHWCILQSCRFSTWVLPVSSFAKEKLLEHVPAATATKMKVVHNGVDLGLMRQADGVERKQLVATICGGSTWQRIQVKGIDFYLELARATPEIEFLVVGLSGFALEWVTKQKTKNLKVIPWVEPAELPELYSEVSVVCQFSRYEAFGVAVVEGMACGCMPVGCTFTATKEIIEGTPGFLIDELNVEKAALAVRTALAVQNNETRNQLRASVRKRFSLTNRNLILLSLLKEIN